MAGELWRERLQIGKETTAGTAVAATRILYMNSIKHTKTRDPRFHKFATGSRDNVRAYTSGAVAAAGQAKVPVSADELIEWLLLGIRGGVTPTAPSGATLARLWTFTPGTTLDSATLERDDGSGNLTQLTGVRADKIQIQGAVGAANDATIDFFAQDRTDAWAGPLTGALSSRTPTFLEGWQTRLWLTTFGGTVSSTLAYNALINWDLQVMNSLGRKYTALNTKAASAITFGELGVSAKLLLEATAASAISELANWNADTKRLMTLEFLSPVDEIEAGTADVQTVTITGTPTGGNFTLTLAGQTTAAIAFNAAASAVQTAINALFPQTAGVVCTGGPLPGSGVVCTFSAAGGLFQNEPVPLMTHTDSFTGGASPAASVAHTTTGRSGRRYVAIDIPGAWTSPDVDTADANTRSYTFPLQYVYDPTNAYGIQFRIQTNRTAGY